MALAKELVRRGCDLTIVARSKADLQQALAQLQQAAEAHGRSPKLQALPADIQDPAQIAAAARQAEEASGPIDVLICNAGLSIPGLFLDQALPDFERQVSVNYLGTVATIKAALPGMVQRRSGHVVVVGSVQSVLGFAGYSSYAPTKWALRGLADCLHNELQGTGVRVSVAYPPDTDTPGYKTEGETKPELCNIVNDALGSELFSPDKVAACLVRGIEKGRYHLLTPDPGCNLLILSMTGLSPRALPLLVSIMLGWLLPLVQAVFSRKMNQAASRYNTARAS